MKFRTIRNETIDLIRAAKRNYYVKLQNSLNDKTMPSSKWWSIAKKVASINNTSSNSILHYNNQSIIHPKDKAETFNEHFTSFGSELNFDYISDLPPLCPYELKEINISEQDVLDQFHLLKPNKPAGPDNLLPKIIKFLSPSLTTPLKLLFQKTLQNGSIPDVWKSANVNALYKGKGSKEDINNN